MTEPQAVVIFLILVSAGLIMAWLGQDDPGGLT